MNIDHSKTYKNRSLKNIPHQVRLGFIKKTIRVAGRVESYCDVGCSNGYITRIISEESGARSVVGYDHCSENLELAAAAQPGANCLVLDLNVLRKCDEVYDLVTCFETLEHVGDLKNAIANLLSLKKEGGLLFLSVPIEVGLVGWIKALLKVYLYGYKFSEISNGQPEGTLRRQYFHALRTGGDISAFRPKASGYDTHFGFDCHQVDQILRDSACNYRAWNKFTTRFYLIR